MTATTRHRFTPRAVESRWTLAGAAPAGARAEAHFPSTGPAVVVARLRDGTVAVALDGRDGNVAFAARISPLAADR